MGRTKNTAAAEQREIETRRLLRPANWKNTAARMSTVPRPVPLPQWTNQLHPHLKTFLENLPLSKRDKWLEMINRNNEIKIEI